MPRALTTPDRLFDRTWRPGHPFQPRVSTGRRWGMLTLFVVLCAMIGIYRYLTDPKRVVTRAQQYLSQLTGAHVKIHDASLSIFEGLRLDGVDVYADDSESPESLIFSATKFLVQHDLRALFEGRIEATR